jgi:hypothetical protein
MSCPFTAMGTVPISDELVDDQDLHGFAARQAEAHRRSWEPEYRAQLEREWQAAAVDRRGRLG